MPGYTKMIPKLILITIHFEYPTEKRILRVNKVDIIRNRAVQNLVLLRVLQYLFSEDNNEKRAWKECVKSLTIL